METRRKPVRGFETVLAVNAKAGPGEDLPEGTLYSGPFYIDVDVEESLKKAITIAKKVVAKLTLFGVAEDEIRIWATGKKGFHITVPEAVFTKTRGTLHLPAVYKQLVIEMGMPNEIDWVVYSEG